MSLRWMALAIGLLWVLAQPVAAQPNPAPAAAVPLPPPREPLSDGPQAPGDAVLPPYEPQLDHLAELMGALAYLRDLCGKGDGSEWRAKMSALIEVEATTPIRRERLAGAYNRGFRDYETTYRTCTRSGEAIILRFLDEGDRLAKELSTRFGGG